MGEFVDKIRATRKSDRLDFVCEVPEWEIDGKPMRIYRRPRCIKDAEKAEKYAKQSELGERGVIIYAIIFEALDEKGDNIFTLEDKGFLLNETHPVLLNDITVALCARPSREDLKKK